MAPVSEIIYCPDPRYFKTIELPKSIVASQYFEANFAAGSLVDVAITRRSDALTIASAPSEVLKPIVSLPSEIFSFHIYHDDEKSRGGVSGRSGTGGDKGSGSGGNREPKE